MSVSLVDQKDMPFQRSLFVSVADRPGTPPTIECDHKYCNSRCGRSTRRPRSKCTEGGTTSLIPPAGYADACKISRTLASLNATRQLEPVKIALYTVPYRHLNLGFWRESIISLATP